MVECLVCGGAIQPGRLEIMPDTTVCVSCTTEMKTLGVMVPSNGKCGLTLKLVPGEDKRGPRSKSNEIVGTGSKKIIFS